LGRSYSPGRPSIRDTELQPRLNEYLLNSPRFYGWAEDVWTVKIIIAELEKEFGHKFGTSTIERLLKDSGYSYKRAKKTVPDSAPSKEEKLVRVKEIAGEILKLKEMDDIEVVFLDESHFSNEPYVIRGWSKTNQPFPPRNTAEKRESIHFWGLRAGEKIFLLEEFTKKQC
jgi:hypothetical protein